MSRAHEQGHHPRAQQGLAEIDQSTFKTPPRLDQREREPGVLYTPHDQYPQTRGTPATRPSPPRPTRHLLPALPTAHLEQFNGVLEEFHVTGGVARKPQRRQETDVSDKAGLKGREPRQRQQRAQLPHGVRHCARPALAEDQLRVLALEVLLAARCRGGRQ